MSSLAAAPADPWTAERPRSGAPRLVTYVHAERSRAGGVVVLSAALWGGHHERQVRIGRHEAYALGRELVALAETLEHTASMERLAARERASARRGGRRTPVGVPGRVARPTLSVRPMARSGSSE